MEIIVPMSQMNASSLREDELLTYSLGSCLGITMHDRVLNIGGLIHCMLPDSGIHPQKAQQNPCMFVDTGTQALLDLMIEKGCLKKHLVIKAAGGACMMSDSDAFRIGQRNHESLLKFLETNDLSLAAENVGGNSSRTVRLKISTGKVCVKYKQHEVEL